MEVIAEHGFNGSVFRRKPQLRDYWLFFVGIPASIAFLFSLIGIKLIAGMPYLDGFAYMLLHMFLAWWSVALGATLMRRLLRDLQPSVVVLVVTGFAVSMVPTAVLFSQLGDWFAAAYPVFAENRASKVMPSWSLEYIAHFVRYSSPAIALYLAGVYGYRFATGVDWLGYSGLSVQQQRGASAAAAARSFVTDVGPRSRAAESEAAATAAQSHGAGLRVVPPMAGAIAGSRLPSDAEIFAIKAEQHYIKIWSAAGTDLVRYRFRDLQGEFAECNAAQVHRSWWVNFDSVEQVRRAGRSVELVVNDDIVVPVSLSHKTAVLTAVGSQRN